MTACDSKVNGLAFPYTHTPPQKASSLFVHWKTHNFSSMMCLCVCFASFRWKTLVCKKFSRYNFNTLKFVLSTRHKTNQKNSIHLYIYIQKRVLYARTQIFFLSKMLFWLLFFPESDINRWKCSEILGKSWKGNFRETFRRGKRRQMTRNSKKIQCF